METDVGVEGISNKPERSLKQYGLEEGLVHTLRLASMHKAKVAC